MTAGNDDFASLWINPALGGAETTPTAVSTDVGTDTASLSTVVLRQGAAGNAATLRLGSILVGTTWASVTPTSGAATPTINTVGTPTAFSTIEGNASTSQSFTASGTTLSTDILIAAPTNFEVSTDNTTFSGSVTLPQTGGSASGLVYVRIAATAPVGAVSGNITLSSTGATSQTVAVTGNVISASAPVVTATPTSLTGFSTTAGVFSASQTFSVSGTNLGTNDLTVTAPTGYEVATTGGYSSSVSLTPTAGTVSSTTISVRISAAATAGAATGNVVVASTGATSVNVAVSGTVAAATVVNYISITAPATPYSQNFDGLGATTLSNAFSATVGSISNLSTVTSSSTLNGWYGTRNGGSGTAAVPLTADTGAASSGGFYSFGSATTPTDRALGVIASGTNSMTFGALVKNDTGATLTGLTFSFTAEFWRSSTNVQNILKFAYGKVDGVTITNTNFLTEATASLYSSLDIVGPPPLAANGILDGNVAPNQSSIVSVTLPITLAAGEVACIRWSDTNDAGNDAALAVDDFTLVGENSTILVPAISLASGTYLTDQTVFVSNFASYVAGETLRYTLDGSDPTAASTAYNNGTGIPLTVGIGTKTLKVAAFPTAGGRSFIAIGNYILPLDVANLTALRASATGTNIYRVTGPITFTASYSNRNTKFFQDSGAGIQVDDSTDIARPIASTTPYAVGDNVQNVIGSLSTFNEQLQFVPKAAFGDPVSTGNAVTPVSRTVATLTDADQGRLVTITGVTFTSAGSPYPAPNFTSGTPGVTGISDGTAGTFQNLFGFPPGSTIPTGPNTVTGIVQKTLVGTTSTITVSARTLADIVFTGLASLTITPDKTTIVEGITGTPDEAAVTITRNGSTAADLTLDLSVVAAGQLQVDLGELPVTVGYRALPTTATILAGETSTTVYLIPTNDAVFTGNRTATFSVAAAGFTTANQVFNITEDDAAGNSYATWSATNAPGQTPKQDYDQDGVSNGVEYFFGATGSTFTPNPQLVANKITFPKDASATGATGVIETSLDLVTWTPVTADASVPGFISYTLPTGQGKIFVRLNVVVAP